MEPAAAAELKTVLVGVPLPAGKDELLEYAVRQRAEPQLLDALRSLPDREYASLDGIVEDLLHVQPSREAPAPSRPREESGRPPGGEAYTERQPEPGAVRASGTT
jgi:hypothetical protein